MIRALLLQTERSYFSLGYEINSNLQIKASYEKRTDAFSTDIVPTKFLDQVNGQTVPDGSTADLYGIQVDWNHYQYESSTIIGDGLSLFLKRGQTRGTSNDSFYTLLATRHHFHEIAPDLVLAQRVQLGHTTSMTLQYWHYLGGLESIRGFKDNRFAAGNYWLSNSELRYLCTATKTERLRKFLIWDSAVLLTGSGQNHHSTSTTPGAPEPPLALFPPPPPP